MEVDPRGVLYPGRLPEFHRLSPPSGFEWAVRWFWIPEWDLEPGLESRQELLPFPVCHLVVESGILGGDPATFTLTGPPTRRSERVLSGRGWAVGAYLLPAVAPRLLEHLSSTEGSGGLAALRDSERAIDDPELVRAVTTAMEQDELGGDRRRERAVRAMAEWIHRRVPSPDELGELANRLGELVADPSVTRVDQLPGLLHVSPRTLQRLAYRHFGLSPHSMIRRRRLQEAAGRLREDPEISLSALAGELGYADHAHFTRDFAAVLGLAPSEYRMRVAATE